jgi:heme exporter protein B
VSLPEPSPVRIPGFATQVFRIAAKDLRIEWKSREILLTMGYLAVVIVLAFAFAFVTVGGERLSPSVTSGILWVSVFFSGTVALSRTFDRERDGEAIRALLLTPISRSAIYLGKLIGVVVLMAIVEVVVVPLTAMFFSAELGQHLLWTALILGLGNLGYAAVGVVFSAALLRSKSRDVLLSALLFPLVLPVLIAGARATSILLDPKSPDLASAVFWTQFLGISGGIFMLLGLWAFEPVLSGD